MKLDMGFDYKKIINTLLNFGSRYRIIITSALLLLVGGYVLQRINTLTVTELDIDYKNQRISEIERVEFDQDSIDAIVELNESDVNITSDFAERNNPFAN